MKTMCVFYPHGHELHSMVQHPERPQRVESVREALQAQGWWQPGALVPAVDLSTTVLEGVHDPAYLHALPNLARYGDWLDQDTYLTPHSWDLALQSAGGAAAVASAIWAGQVSCGFALCRPPGHHATRDQGMGFCLLNNVAIAAQYLLSIHGAQKVAIVDLDLHHGNGTQDIFYDRGDVLYVSTHQWPLYPGTGRIEETGTGRGAMATANVPLPPGTGDTGFLAAMNELVLPVLDRYQPEMILVSLGLDAHWMDPLGGLQLSATGYGVLVRKLSDWCVKNCAGRIALILEGGYNLESVAAGALAACAAMLGETVEDALGSAPHQETTGYRSVIQAARKAWQLE